MTPHPSEPPVDPRMDARAVAVVRALAMDAPRRANSGHPGTAMALAPLAQVLFGRVMRHDPADPGWPDRDRFVLSNGHASILLYSMLHLCGYGLELDDLRAFRQWGSRTPGHPERLHTPGVEVTTGPLGQGLANAVGMAIAERRLRATFGEDVVSHHTYVIAGDGCLEEGISHEAASLAGHLGLDRLVCVYDDNHITIDGPTELALDDDPIGRFSAYGWRTVRLGEIGDDMDALEAALVEARDHPDGRPTLLALRSHIGTPSPAFTDNPKAHGDPFPPEEIAVTKEILGLPPDETFFVPADVLEYCRARAARGSALREAWQARFESWAASGDRRAAWEATFSLPDLGDLAAKVPTFEPGDGPIATRQAITACMDATADQLPGLVPGSADLTGNTGMALAGAIPQDAREPGGRLVHYGIREHAMGAVMTGMAAHGGVLPIGGTFFVFSDYMRAAVRVAALSRVHVLYSWTHDSVGLGEDGPTHQPVEQLASLRAMPGLSLFRPADANEVAAAWPLAVTSEGPVGLVLSRQKLPVLAETAELARDGVARGAYVLHDPDGAPDVVLVATGSEVAPCRAAADLLAADSVAARVVSFPSWDRFALQDRAYRDAVFPPGVPRLSVEAASTFGWERHADASIGIDRFGASAPGDVVLAELGFTPEHIASRAAALVDAASGKEPSR